MKNSPIIIIGMHRSGTTMLTKVLEESGVFFGKKKDINNESLFFLEINNWILKQVYASWDNPYPIQYLTLDELNYIKNICSEKIKSIYFYKFLGIKNYIKFNNTNLIWGWKDPRNTYTLPIWRKIFPNARIIHIYRNPVDVAHSLKKRIDKESLFMPKLSFSNSLKKCFLFGKITGYKSVKVRNLNEGYKLWSSYVKTALDYEDVIHIQYENLLDNPREVLLDLFKHLDINVRNNKIDEYSKYFKKDRRYAFVRDEALYSFYQSIKSDSILYDLGYNNIKE